ncbi:hypothetical protein H7H78_12780 [Mycobacterium shinjukuense]|uniref:hypothetical protein n=1 Tax=Mycobacterium shinjukuense TaxID=398694 RepID=UPI001301D519|nr:hypothetical protein [Mycobacterium shinjukuense]MCV6986275.1 hypothetical protein [Mycobacterium shinjukuense]
MGRRPARPRPPHSDVGDDDGHDGYHPHAGDHPAGAHHYLADDHHHPDHYQFPSARGVPT